MKDRFPCTKSAGPPSRRLVESCRDRRKPVLDLGTHVSMREDIKLVGADRSEPPSPTVERDVLDAAACGDACIVANDVDVSERV